MRVVDLSHALTLKDQQVLAALWVHHHLTAIQVTRLLYRPTILTYVRARLKVLIDAGYLAADCQKRPGRTGSAPLVYLLGPKGVRHLRGLGYSIRRYRPQEAMTRSYLHYLHCLPLADVLLSLTLLAHIRPEIALSELRHEHQLHPTPVTVRTAGGDTVTTTVIPDAWCDLLIQRHEGRERMCLAIELDTGTEHKSAWLRKLRSLLVFATGPYQAAYGVRSLTVAVVATPGAARVAELLRWTEAELAAQGVEQQATLFWFTGLPAATTNPAVFWLAPTWSVPYTDRPFAILGTEEPHG